MEGGRTAAGPAVTEAELRKFTTAFYSDQLGDGLLTLVGIPSLLAPTLMIIALCPTLTFVFDLDKVHCA